MSAKNHSTRARNERKSNLPKSAPPFIMMPREICDDPNLTPSERTLLAIITGHAWGNKMTCHPSTATLAEKLGRHRDHVRRLIRGLQARGYLIRRPADNPTYREFILPWRIAPVAAPMPSTSSPLFASPTPPAAPTLPMTAAEERADLVEMCQNPCPALAAMGRRRLEKFDADLAARALSIDPPEPVPPEPVPSVSEAAPRGGADVVPPWAQMSSPPWALAPSESKEVPSKKGTGAGGLAAQEPPPAPQKTPESPAQPVSPVQPISPAQREHRRAAPRAPYAPAIRTRTPLTAFEALMDAPAEKHVGLGKLRDLNKMNMIAYNPEPPRRGNAGPPSVSP